MDMPEIRQSFDVPPQIIRWLVRRTALKLRLRRLAYKAGVTLPRAAKPYKVPMYSRLDGVRIVESMFVSDVYFDSLGMMIVRCENHTGCYSLCCDHFWFRANGIVFVTNKRMTFEQIKSCAYDKTAANSAHSS